MTSTHRMQEMHAMLPDVGPACCLQVLAPFLINPAHHGLPCRTVVLTDPFPAHLDIALAKVGWLGPERPEDGLPARCISRNRMRACHASGDAKAGCTALPSLRGCPLQLDSLKLRQFSSHPLTTFRPQPFTGPWPSQISHSYNCDLLTKDQVLCRLAQI